MLFTSVWTAWFSQPDEGLEPFTETKPKAMVEVGGPLMLSHCFEQLCSLDADRLVVVGYRRKQIMDFYGDEFAGVPIEYRVQEERLGMAHALLAAEAAVTDDFMLMDCDNVMSTDLGEILHRHREDDVDRVLLVHASHEQPRRRRSSISTPTERSREF